MQSDSKHELPDTTAFLELLKKRLPKELNDIFHGERDLVVSRAPGRLDLMGGIADYSGSLVLQFPIACATHVAIQLQERNTLRIVSVPNCPDASLRYFEMPLEHLLDSGKSVEYSAARERFARDSDNHWAAYVAGVFLVLMREKGVVFSEGARMLISSAVPEGKGVSSSAALEVATMKAVKSAYGIDISPREMAFLCQRVENLVAGAPCGVMDQMTSACGEADKLLALLCQPGELKGTVELPRQLAVWGIDSGIRHSIGGADYGRVRTAAFMGYRMITDIAGLPCRETAIKGHVKIDGEKWSGYLANVTPAEFEESFAGSLPEQMSGAEFLERYAGITDTVTTVNPTLTYPVRHATAHPIYEHARVNKFARILNDWKDKEQAEEIGKLMYESHESYSACGLGSSGTDELVKLVREAGEATGLYGAKITGGGSGGTVAILGHREAARAIQAIADKYESSIGHRPYLFSGSSPGAVAFGHLKFVRHS